MKILYDYQIFTLQTYGGISRYFYELIKTIEKQKAATVKLGFKFSKNAYLNEKTIKDLLPFFPNNRFLGKERLYKFLNESQSKISIAKGDYDILHPTYYNPYFLNNIKNRPYVITCYDMIQEIFVEKYPEFSTSDPMLFEKKKKVIMGATKVIAISEQTKKDIMRLYGIDGQNIEVIYLGSSLTDTSADEEAIVKDPYLFFVGNRDLYKNFSGILDGIQEILKGNQLKLVCAGGGIFKQDEIELIRKYGLEEYVIYVAFKTDSELSNLYHNAISFLFPSLYEGFGIPVLEAFACKCPIAMSAGGSLIEVGGNATAYFEPENPASIQEVVAKVVNDSNFRMELVNKGTEQLKLFSWENTCNETISLYKTLI